MSPGARPRAAARLPLAAVLAAVSATLCGCDVPRVEGYFSGFDLNLDIPTHKIPIWRRLENYCMRFSYKDPVTKQRRWNSCMDANLSALETCSQHGRCVPFDENEVASPVFYCKCDLNWCGLECETMRTSQSTVFLVSVVVGMFGIDEFYIGNLHEALAKLVLFMCGVTVWFLHSSIDVRGHVSTLWEVTYTSLMFGPWILDVVRIGSAPVDTPLCPLAADLPRWAFTSFTVMVISFHALGHGIVDMYYEVLDKRRHDEEISSRSGKTFAQREAEYMQYCLPS